MSEYPRATTESGLKTNEWFVNDTDELAPDTTDELGGAELVGFYERYTGICDVYSPDEARAMANTLRQERKNSNRKVMIGVMTHPFVLSNNPFVPEKIQAEIRELFPNKEIMANGFTDDPDVLNTVHYADLYGPDGPRKSFEAPNVFKNLELIVQHGGEDLHAIQLDLTWPEPGELAKFRDLYPDVAIILQTGKFAFKELGSDQQAIINRLQQYTESVDYVLFDTSMGTGDTIETDQLLPLLRATRSELPDLGLAVAGGLGPDSVGLLKPIADEFPDISIDAQGNLKLKEAARDSAGHFVATHPADLDRSTEYIIKSCKILDNQPSGVEYAE